MGAGADHAVVEMWQLAPLEFKVKLVAAMEADMLSNESERPHSWISV